jgi:HAMP domain-containing protein
MVESGIIPKKGLNVVFDAQSKGLILTIRRHFISLIVVLGLTFACIGYYCLNRVLRERFDQHSSVIATSLAETAAGYVLSKDALGLHPLITKYGDLEGIAYAIIQDRDGNVIANSLLTLSPEIQKSLTYEERRKIGRRNISLEGKSVLETRRPILEGRLGTVRVGVWADAIENEIHKGFVLLLVPLILVVIGAAIVAGFLAGRVIGPFNRLIEIADRISTGDLDVPIRAESQDEFGKLTHSLERMRSSLKAAMVRLEQN